MRVLLVEDDPGLAQILVRALDEDGYAVDHAPGAVEAQYRVDANQYDLLILDIGLPDGDGIELCRTLRAGGAEFAVLLLTARDGIHDKVAGLDAGADDYLTKPFDYPELAARVRALLRRPTADRSPMLEAGDITLDPASRRVWRGAITVPLTAKEFNLLEVLLRRKGEVITRTDLIEHAWDEHYDGVSNVVDVHIANLRRKLESADSPAPIETIRGVGYQLQVATAE